MSIKDLFESTSEKIIISYKSLPKHIGILISGCKEYSEKNNMPISNVNETKFLHIKNIIKISTKINIPLLTFYMHDELTIEDLDFLEHFFSELCNWDLIKQNKVKISILGKWYGLPERVIQPMKKIIEETRDYDQFFFNFCINYDGQEEIIDAIKLISTKIKLNRIDPEKINKNIVKEHIYTSYFLPPDLIIITGKEKKIKGFLLWDCINAKIYFANKLWPDFGKDDFLKSLEWFEKN